jgi:uncharacterized membrane protein
MKRFNLTATVSMLAVFLSGAVVGAFGHRLYMVRSVIAEPSPTARPSPEDFRRRYVEELTARLKLQPNQVAQLNEILDLTRERFRVMRERSRPEGEQIKQDQRNSIRAMLNPSQQAEYEKILQERDRKRAAEHKPN